MSKIDEAPAILELWSSGGNRQLIKESLVPVVGAMSAQAVDIFYIFLGR